ncbi:hypothetical protein COCVIDRAFT_34773 [Bipolaris victoriae FI3]|uniref:Uncharacterized protein n=2 Tax=Bipolaris TaxID=33194 RepID=W6YN25_COCC2|nr:uncharacterized protein COCCADRAFT_31979 [Bipolaris zeicola 26-R-13]XP_014560261.1 hypothetical protein COCVIDRAFT_34773 [Bipolaris victoriae FI3]EUC38918.1 hypothetical protein COCCADRAFT_31979 [Bipolaris zeicola 26-R-13]
MQKDACALMQGHGSTNGASDRTCCRIYRQCLFAAASMRVLSKLVDTCPFPACNLSDGGGVAQDAIRLGGLMMSSRLI